MIKYIGYVITAIKNIVSYVRYLLVQLCAPFKYLLGLNSSNKGTKKQMNFYFKLILLFILIICFSYLGLFSSISYTH